MPVISPDPTQQSSGNPVLDSIDQLPPPAKSALAMAHRQVLSQQSAQVPGPVSTPAAPSPAAPQAAGPPTSLMQTPGAPPTSLLSTPAAQGHQAELNRLTAPGTPGVHNHQQTGLSGIGQIKSPWARIPLQIAEAVGGGLFPGIDMMIPGTQLHHQMLVRGAQGNVAQDEKGAAEQGRLGLENAQTGQAQAQTANLNSLPALHQAQSELASEKLANTEQHQQDVMTEKTHNDQAKIDAQLRQHGYKMGTEGTIEPLGYEEMSPDQQAVHDLKASQQELTDANAALVKAKKDNIPAAQQMAQQRINVAQQNAATAAGRLGLSKAQYQAEYLGQDQSGNALPGAQTDQAGKPIGPKMSAAQSKNGPTVATRGKADQAQIIIDAGEDLKKQIDAHKDKLGNLGSYWDAFKNGSPIADPVVSSLMAQIKSYAALQAAAHGYKGSQVMSEFEKEIGGIPKNPEAIKGAIDGIARTMHTISGVGHPGQTGATDPAMKAYADKYFGGDLQKAQAYQGNKR